MFILNASFIFERGLEPQFLSWFEEIRCRLDASAPNECTVSSLRDTNGESYDQADAHTIAAQWQFDSFAEAWKWREMNFATIADSFADTFGSHTIVFTSIFEKLKTYK